jgi:hypothetical protein
MLVLGNVQLFDFILKKIIGKHEFISITNKSLYDKDGRL